MAPGAEEAMERDEAVALLGRVPALARDHLRQVQLQPAGGARLSGGKEGKKKVLI